MQESEYEKIRIEHFAYLHKEHKRSIKFSIERLSTIRAEIDELMKVSNGNRLNLSDFDFLLDIAGLVIAARRALSFSYPVRYYLEGETK